MQKGLLHIFKILKNITFENKFGINSKENIWLGLKIATISGLMAFSGVFFVALDMIFLGKVFVILGLVGAFVGMATHFIFDNFKVY